MTQPGPRSDVEDDKASIHSSEPAETERISLSLAPKLQAIQKTEISSNGFLAAPPTAPLRPLSPDTLSILSLDEYETLHLHHSRQQGYEIFEPPTPSPQYKGWRGKLQVFWVRNKGCAYMLLAQLFGTLMNVTTRLLEVEGNNGKGMHPFQILFARMTFTVTLSSAWMWYNKTPHFPLGLPEIRWLLVARGFGGFFGVFGMYYALLYLPLADATVITFLAPSLSSWACSILINEPFTRLEQIGGLVSMVGVVLIARPTSLFSFGSAAPPPASGDGDVALSNGTVSAAAGADAMNYDNVTPMQRLGAVGIALVGVLGAACAYTTIRWIGKRAHPLISVNYFAVWCTIVSTVMQLILPGVGFLFPASLKEWGYLIFLGICGFTMQFLLSSALSYERSSRTMNLIYTQMLYALGFDKVIFGHTPGLLSILGSSLILGSAIVVTTHNSPTTNKPTEGPRDPDDEESGQRLINNTANAGAMSEMDSVQIQDVPLQALQSRT